MKILITGANGFLGSHLVENGIKEGHLIISGIRKGASTKFIDGKGSTIVELDYENTHQLNHQLTELKSATGAFDLVIHNAGITKSNSITENMRVNKGLTENLVEAIKRSKILGSQGKICYVSSMAALGPVHADGPVSSYGASKLEAENVIIMSGLPYLIFRPTAIYGERDSAFLSLFQVAKWGIYPNIATPDQKITMMYAGDVARMMLHHSKNEKNLIIHLDDYRVYNHADLRDALSLSMNKKIRMFNVPGQLVKGVIYLMEKAAGLTGKKPLLTVEKYHEISKDWNHDFSVERKKMDHLPLMPLSEGFRNSYQYYRKQKLL